MIGPAPAPAPAPGPAPQPPAGAAAAPGFHPLVVDSFLGGLCPLLPIPIVDDLVLARMRRRMVARMAARWGVRLTPAQLSMLTGRARPWSMGRFFRKALIYPFKELLRKVLYFLAVKDAVDTFSLLLHHGYLLHAALAAGALPAGPLDDARVSAVAGAVHDTLAATDTRALRRALGALRRRRGEEQGYLGRLDAALGRRLAAGPPRSSVTQLGS